VRVVMRFARRMMACTRDYVLLGRNVHHHGGRRRAGPAGFSCPGEPADGRAGAHVPARAASRRWGSPSTSPSFLWCRELRRRTLSGSWRPWSRPSEPVMAPGDMPW